MTTYDLQAFARSVLQQLGAPVNAANLAALCAWHTAEGGTAAYNPLNTTQPAAGATNYNSVGVKNYPDYATGVRATVVTLTNGYYPGIVAALHRGVTPYDVAACHAELDTWGTGWQPVVAELDSGAFGTWPRTGTPTPTPAPQEAPEMAAFLVTDPDSHGTWIVAGDFQSKVPAKSAADAQAISQAPGVHYLTLTAAQLAAIPAAT